MTETDKVHERQLTQWLNAQGAAFRAALLMLRAAAICAIGCQIILYWYLCQIAETLLIEKKPALPSDLSYLTYAAMAWVLFEWLRQAFSRRLQLKICQSLQQQLHRQLQVGQSALVRQHNHFFWQQLWQTHIPSIAEYLVKYRIQQTMAVITPLLGIVLLFPVSWVVAVILLISMPVVPLFMYLIGSGTAALHRKHFVALERLGSLFSDRLRATQMLQIHNAHHSQLQVLQDSSKKLNEKTMQVVSMGFLSTTVLDFFSTLAIALVAVFVGFNLLGELRIGDTLTLSQGLFMLLISPLCFAELKLLGRYYHQRSAAIAATSELKPLLTSPLTKTAPGPFEGFDWHNFHLSAPPLHARHLSLNPGDWVQLQGQSGSGKSVFIEGLMGQRPASHCIKGKKALLTQHAVITPATVRENLCLGHMYTESALWGVLEQVELRDWAERLPQRLDTQMGAYPPLSGGQRQRLALARILLTDAQVVFLDEPTTHLTEAQHLRISEIIRHTFHDRTLIWASHKSLPGEWFTKSWYTDNLEVRD